jgi:predicted HicB family RNase H-like nuclease
MAENEGISLNQYIVYALTRQITLAYTVHAEPPSRVAEQQASYTALLQSLGQASFEEIESAMARREKEPPERELTPEVVKRIQRKLKKRT